MVRAKAGRTALTAHVVQRLGPGDHLVDLTPSRGTRAAHPTLPATLRVRAVHVHHRGFRPYLLFTSLLDPVAYPAAELLALYHERWELELTFDEVKTHTLERAEALRSQAPTRVEQEVWGLLLAYNLLRLVMSRAAPRGCMCAPASACGDGMRDGAEQCDGADLGGSTCASLGYNNGGTLACTAGCGYDASGCDCQATPQG